MLKEELLIIVYKQFDDVKNVFLSTTKNSTSRILVLRDLSIYSRKIVSTNKIYFRYKSKLLTLIINKFTRQNYIIIEQYYCVVVKNNRSRIFDLVEQNKYLSRRVRALKKLLKYCDNRKKVIFVLLMLAIYDVVTIIKILLFVKNNLEIIFSKFSKSSKVAINYRDEIANLTFLILNALRDISKHLNLDWKSFLLLSKKFDQNNNLQNFAKLSFQIHRFEIIIKLAIRETWIILEDSLVKTFKEYKSNLIIVVKQQARNKIFKRQVLYFYDAKLRDRAISNIDRDYYLLIRERLA